MKKNKNALIRLFKMLFKMFPKRISLILICTTLSSIVVGMPSVFMQKLYSLIETNAGWEKLSGSVLKIIIIIICIYILHNSMNFYAKRKTALITQEFLYKLRQMMFDSMQRSEVAYFDKNQVGDIMSVYTNDIDTLRQIISQSLPQLFLSIVVVTTNFVIMLYYSFYLALVVLVGLFILVLVVKKVGAKSGQYFKQQQAHIGKLESYIEENLSGLKVVKVFNYEDRAFKNFEKLNSDLLNSSVNANIKANIIQPIAFNVVNFIYIAIALFGWLFIHYKVQNVSFSNLAFSISITIPFLNVTRQVAGNVNAIVGQLNYIMMASAGAERIFKLLDEKSEIDDGDVSLVIKDNQRFWKVGNDYVLLKGDVEFKDVSFGYDENKDVIKNINIYANYGQKVALVGATGSGKTTIINLINRFYDVKSGSITFDGIDVRRIKKSDLRKLIGVVLQDVHLFNGTVMDNIRYGRLDASDEECIEAAKSVSADDFIQRLPQGYQTIIKENGSNLSQGQKQLLSIARCKVSNPLVMILDEATSSIDTQTELLVQNGMDNLMNERTVFVIAHRLSTIKNSDVIMVIDKGEIVERGNHQKLIENRGMYYRLYTGDFNLE